MKCYKITNYITDEQKVVEIPDSCSTYEDDMDKIVTCPSCGKKLKFGDTYTSFTYMTNSGFGFGVCEDCYSKELKERFGN